MNPAARELYASIAVALARVSEARVSDQGIHEARKALKKARAALRLLRPGLDPATYRAENGLLRDAGRALAPLREPKALLEALRGLRLSDPDALPAASVEGLERALRAERKRVASDRAAQQAALATSIRLLKHSLARAERPDFAAMDDAPLAKGMRRIYRNGRRALAAARESRSPEALHEWRKQSKYLLNALETLHGARGGRRARRAERLADRLGDDHDLDALASRASRLKTLQAVIAGRRAELQKQALRLGRKLYARKPKRFAR